MARYESKSYMAGWLRGFFDGEGSVSFRKQSAGRKHTSYYVTVTNTDPILMNLCGTFLTALGIAWTEWPVRRMQNRKPCRVLHITRAASIKVFQSRVGFYAKDKQAKLDQIVDWINRPTIDEIRAQQVKKLWDAGHSLRCITKQLGLKPGNHNRLKRSLELTGVQALPYGRGRTRCSH